MAKGFRAAERLDAVGVSEILRISAEANALRRAGNDVIVLGAGEPDFDTPEHVKAAAERAIRAGETKYTALDGTPELKAAIQAKLARDNGIEVAFSEITVGAGAKQIIFNAMMASLNPGDEVVVPTPYWTSYVDIVRIAGGTVVAAPCEEADGFRLRPEALERAITSRTRWVLLNSPSNPSGAAHTHDSLRALLEVLAAHPWVWILSDDIYESILYDNRPFLTPAGFEPTIANRTLTLNGVSKAYAMTGWRIGYATGPEPLIRAMSVVQSQSTSCPCSVSQAAAIEALAGPQGFLIERCHSFQMRRDLVVEQISATPGLSCRKPDGAFYLLANCKNLLGTTGSKGERIETDGDLARYLLSRSGVAVVPGSAFGQPGYFRISYATSTDVLRKACDRIATGCSELH